MTDKKKKHDIVHKGVCSYPQTENFVAAKQFLIINEDGKRYLLVKLTNNRAENVTGATLFVEQFNERGDKISADNVHVSGFDGYPQKSFAVEQKILVASTCVDCRITVAEAEFGKYTYKADDIDAPGYKFETEPEPERKIPAEIMKRAGKKGITVEPRSLKMPTLILLISVLTLVAAFVAIWIYTNRFVANEERFLHDGVYYSFVGGDRSDGSDVYVVGVRGSRTEIVVPDEIEGHNVVRVDAGAFLGNKNIKKVSFGGEIAIGERAFFGCTALESINLKNATDIATDAFSGCTKLRSVELDKVFNIGDGAFNRCTALTSLKIAAGGPDIIIGNAAFSNCENLRTVDISRTIVYGENYTLFYKCLNVTSLHLSNFECGNDERNITVLFGGAPALTSIIIDDIDTVGAGLCEGLTTVTTVRFNDVTTPQIGNRAFKACEKLTEVIMPAAVTKVGDEAFCGTAVTSFDGSALEFLGEKAFSDCKSLVTFTMNGDTELTAIGNAAFMNCEKLKAVTIPLQVTVIGEQAFSGCKALTNVAFDEDSKIATITAAAFENCTRLSVIDIPATVRTIGERAFAGCASLSEIDLPVELITVGTEAFAGAGVIDVKLPKSVTGIGCGAFGACEKLRSLTLPFVGGSRDANRFLPYIFGAESIDDGASVVPSSLKSVTVTDSDTVPNNAFYGCMGLANVVYDFGPLYIGENAFRDCRALSRIELADGLVSIGARAFSDCASLTEIILPDTLTSIGRNAFSGCSALETLVTPFVGASRNSNGFLAYMFGGETFEDADRVPTSLKKVELTDTETVSAGAFVGTTIREVVLGDVTTSIAENAFMGNRKLNMITLPSSLTFIGDQAFYGCYFLYEVFNFSDLQLTVGEPSYGYVAYYALKVHVVDEPRLTVVGYNGYDFVQSDDNWYLVRYPEDEPELVLPAAIDTVDYSFSQYIIHDRLFIDDKNITSVYVPSNAKTIGAETFSGCESLTAVTVAKGVESIGAGAFIDCTALTEFVFPSGVTTIADQLFRGCEALEKVVMPTEIDRIGFSAFYGCSALKEIVIPTGCEAIGDSAFGGCTSLTKADIPDCCTEIGSSAFGGCVMLYDVEIPSECKVIGNGAFINCRRIKSVILPATLERIGSYAFDGCSKLYEVYNYSGYVVIPRSSSYGSVAEHAYAVYESIDATPLDSIITNDGLHYYRLDDVWCLVDYYGADGNVNIGGFTYGTETVDDIVIIDYAFQQYNTIKSVTVGEEVSRIGNFAFVGCEALESLEISADKLIVNAGAFAECKNLDSLVVMCGDVDFGTEAFLACGLTFVSLTGGDFTISDSVFYNNTELNYLTVDCNSLFVYETAFFDGLAEASIKCYGSFIADRMAFYGSSLTKLSVQADDVDILNQNFFGGTIAEVYIVGNKSVHIASGAFDACGGLNTLGISGNVVNIDSAAFIDCTDVYASTGIGDLTVTGEQINISNNAFSSSIVKSLTIAADDIALYSAVFLNSAIGELDITCYGSELTVGALLDGATLSALAIDGKQVEISANAFFIIGNLVSLEIVAEDLTIGSDAFFNQYDLESVKLSASRSAEIGVEAFAVCGRMSELVLPSTLKTLSYSAFNNCSSLVELDIPNGVTSIGDYAFGSCASLNRLTLPNGLVSIGHYAFQSCNSLRSLTIPNTVTSIGEYAFMYCNSLQRLVLPAALNVIEEFTFYNCEQLAAIDLPATLTSVGQNAFYGCRSINSLTIPKSVTMIGEYGFGACNTMETLDFLGVPELRNGAFSGCSALKSLDIPGGITEIPDNAFGACYALERLSIPNSVTSIGGSAFSVCLSLTELTIPDSVVSIGGSAFFGCENLSSLKLPRRLDTISEGAFNGCESLAKLTIPNGVTSIGNSAFENCYALSDLTLPNGLTTIGGGAFNNCISLPKLVLPSSLTEIGDSAFAGCTSLTDLDVDPTSALAIGNYAFNNCIALTKLELNNIRSVGYGAFGSCSSLASVKLHLTERSYYSCWIHARAFENCAALKSVEITSAANIYVCIDYYAFFGCGELTELKLPATLNYIGTEAFRDCAKLQYVELPASLVTIEDNAFYGATSLFAVCNKSGLSIVAGSESYGGVAKYAAIVTNDPDKARLTYAESGKNKFVRADGVWYLYACEIDANGNGLPDGRVTTSVGTIDSYAIKCRAFADYISRIIIPKSVSYIQNNAFESVVGDVFYRGTSDEWGSICEGILYYYIYFYVDCVHGYNEWTEIDGIISTDITMSAWTIVKDATCTETGKIERHCSRCGKKEEQEIPIDPYAHDYDTNGECKDCGATAYDDEDDTDAHADNGDGEQSIND